MNNQVTQHPGAHTRPEADGMEHLRTAFFRVFKELQSLIQTDKVNTFTHTENAEYTNKNMREKLKTLSPARYYPRFEKEIFGMGPASELIEDKNISEVIINGKDHLFYEKKGKLYMWQDSFLSDLTFYNFVHRVLEETKTVLSLKQPFADGNWRGRRIHIIKNPLVNVDFHLSFRRHPEKPWTFSKLKDQGWAPEKAINLIEQLLKEKRNILIAGPTSSGKTSVLNACLQTFTNGERVITIEDSSELILPNNFSTKLLTQSNSNSPDTLRNVDQNELVRQSLRMRPDRIIMGEVRSTEAKDLLMALSTGHKGSLGTIHAEDHKQALWRLEMLVQMGAPSWDTYTIRQMIALGIEHLIMLGKYKGERKLMGVYKLSGVEKTGFLFEALFTHLSCSESFFVS